MKTNVLCTAILLFGIAGCGESRIYHCPNGCKDATFSVVDYGYRTLMCYQPEYDENGREVSEDPNYTIGCKMRCNKCGYVGACEEFKGSFMFETESLEPREDTVELEDVYWETLLPVVDTLKLWTMTWGTDPGVWGADSVDMAKLRELGWHPCEIRHVYVDTFLGVVTCDTIIEQVEIRFK